MILVAIYIDLYITMKGSFAWQDRLDEASMVVPEWN